jgi:creatinine amidohydrolase
MRILADMTSAEVKAALKRERRPVVILVIGAVEAHGAHLPLGTDIIQPQDAASNVSERTGAFVAPAIPYGICISTRGFPGTVSVSLQAMHAYVRSVLEGLVGTGFERIMVLTGHAGSLHMAALKGAAQEVVDLNPKVKCVVLSDYDYAYDFIERDPRLKKDGHAGNIETSRIMAMRPELVRPDVTPGSDYPSSMRILPHPERTWTGVRGNAKRASAKTGKRVNEYVVRKLCDLVRELQE